MSTALRSTPGRAANVSAIEVAEPGNSSCDAIRDRCIAGSPGLSLLATFVRVFRCMRICSGHKISV